jgi:hypothetical protein
MTLLQPIDPGALRHQLDSGVLAGLEPITSRVAGSFAWRVLERRHPALIEQVRAAHPYTPRQNRGLDRLLEEIQEGVIRPLHAGAHDHAAWETWTRNYVGRRWTDVPFLGAESYFYRKLLEAVDFFTPGPWFWIDPFEPMKTAELADATLDDELALLAQLRLRPEREQVHALLVASLWGNRADLGFRITEAASAGPGETPSDLIADDSDTLLSALEAQVADIVCLIADNAGRELMSDLVLIDHLMESGLAARASLHLKPHPYYVSDAVTEDVITCMRRLAAATPHTAEVAHRLREAMGDGRLTVSTHWFYCAPLSFHYMPPDLVDELASASLILAKGDLNYRRLVGDCDWPVTTPFTEATAYFPFPVVALRTLKSDVAVGIDAGVAAQLERLDPSWRTDGKRGVIQARL